MEMISEFLEPYICIGAGGILIEGIRRVSAWQNERLEVSTPKKRIVLEGVGLRMEYKSMDSILVKGKIDRIEFRSVKR